MPSIQQVPPGTFYNGVPIPDDWPAWLRNIAVAAETVEYKGVTHTYAVAKRDFSDEAKRFEGFVAYIAGYVLVSEDTPPTFRPYCALHEIVEMTELAGKRGRCLEALKIELAHVPKAVRHLYAAYRLVFFMQLITFHEENGNVDSDDINEMRESLRYLWPKELGPK
ncbi:MAG: hypothetical protein WEC84_00615 [Candidatus Andersenbacteria bacterium]